MSGSRVKDGRFGEKISKIALILSAMTVSATDVAVGITVGVGIGEGIGNVAAGIVVGVGMMIVVRAVRHRRADESR
jgi:hypothetical protein